jgi:putative heme iron utilization protein
MPEPITSAVSDRICKHMNKDHADAVLFYVTAYGNQPNATAATMTAIDSDGMSLMATVDGTQTPVRIAFDHTLEGAEDAHHTLVAMLKQAQTPS